MNFITKGACLFLLVQTVTVALPAAAETQPKSFSHYELKFSYDDLQSKITPTATGLEGSWKLIIHSEKTEGGRNLETLEQLASKKNTLQFSTIEAPHLRDYMKFRAYFADIVDAGVDWGWSLTGGQSVLIIDNSKMIHFEIMGIRNDSMFKDHRTKVFYNYYCRMPDVDNLLCAVKKDEVPMTILNSGLEDNWYFGFSRVK